MTDIPGSARHRMAAVGIWVLTVGIAGGVVLATSDAHWFLLAAAVAVAGSATGLLQWYALPATGWWSGLTILGAAASLQLVNAGPSVSYQHLALPWQADTYPQRVAVLFLVLQALWVFRYWRPKIGESWRLLTAKFGPWRLLALATLMALTSATVSRAVDFYVQELIVGSVLQAVALGSIVATVRALPAGTCETIAERCWRWLGKDTGAPTKVPRVDAWAISLAAIVAATCALLAFAVYQRHPHVPDEVAYLFQARYFAEGWLAMPAPPIPEAFNLDLMTYEASRWYSPAPPGWPAVLAVGAFLGAPWLVNPVLASVCVLLTYLLIWQLYDRVTGRLTIVLLATSPWFLFLGMTLMNHMLSLACALGAAVAVGRIRQGWSLWWGVPGGLGLALLGINRPLEGLIVSGLLGLWVLGGPSRRWTARVAGLGILGMTAVVGGSLTLPYNRALTGDPTKFPIMAYTDSLYGPGTNALGFGADRGLGWGGLDPFPGHSPAEAIINTNLNLFAVNIELLGWATGSFLFLWTLLLLGRLRREDHWLVIAIATVIVIHGLYWFSGGPDFGARYWFLILVPAVALTARGIIVLGSRLGEHGRRAWHAQPLLVAIGLIGMSATIFIPWRAADKYVHYRGMRPDIRELASRYDFGPSVVLIRGERHPDYASAAVYNPLDLTAQKPIYVWDRGPESRKAIAEVYGDRPVWIVNGPTRSGGGYEVVAGPLTPTEFAESSGVQ